jgi:Winged helix-turn helix
MRGVFCGQGAVSGRGARAGGSSVSELAAAHGVHRSWIYKLLARCRAGGYGALEQRSRAPRSSPNRTPADVVETIVSLREQLAADGHDCGATTIACHLADRLLCDSGAVFTATPRGGKVPSYCGRSPPRVPPHLRITLDRCRCQSQGDPGVSWARDHRGDALALRPPDARYPQPSPRVGRCLHGCRCCMSENPRVLARPDGAAP